jgi:hypothetical protein
MTLKDEANKLISKIVVSKMEPLCRELELLVARTQNEGPDNDGSITAGEWHSLRGMARALRELEPLVTDWNDKNDTI